METRFTQFLRSGGNGEFQLKRDGKLLVATSLSIKSEFPNYQALRERFAEKLDEIIASNTAMLLQSVGLQFDPPLTAENLPSVNNARAEALALWEERIAVIWTEWHSHLQRLRPIRESMEANLLRGFAGLVNELRQRGLGVRQYIWRSRDDSKVRSAHAAHDDQVFSWDNPPEGGHPGQAFNCRCIAEPLPPGPYGNVVLAELTIPSDGITSPGAEVGRRLPGGLIARTAAGLALYLALEANWQLQGFTAAASQQRVVSAATTIGADLGTVEGLWAAITYAQAKEAASTGLLPGVPKDGPGAEVFAQGMALYALANPEALRSIQGFNEAVERVGGVAVLAWQEGRLRTRDGNLASGWAEVFPELTDDEKRLGQLPGFTPERIEEFREEYPAEVLGLPDNTGSAPDDAPVGNAISTPVPEEVGPNIVAITNPHSKETISIPEDRKIHILDGDGTGGGHRSGTGAPKKSEFPFDWTDEMILDAIREVAGTGTVVGSARRKGELLIAGEIDGVQIEVVVKPNGEVRTAYPTGGPGVIRNP